MWLNNLSKLLMDQNCLDDIMHFQNFGCFLLCREHWINCWIQASCSSHLFYNIQNVATDWLGIDYLLRYLPQTHATQCMFTGSTLVHKVQQPHDSHHILQVLYRVGDEWINHELLSFDHFARLMIISQNMIICVEHCTVLIIDGVHYG